jgi:putative hydrolase of the HAD superfamily
VIKAITFDFWSTLYQIQPTPLDTRLQFLKTSIEQHGITVDLAALMQATTTARDAWNLAWLEDQRTMMAHEWVDIVLQDLGITLSQGHQAKVEQNLEEQLLANLPHVIAEIRTVIPTLAKNYRLAVISDTGLTPGWVLRQVLTQDKLIDYFTHLTFSDEIGCSKPHPKAFLSTLTALNAQPHEAVHIGDLLRTDIVGAKGVGMRAVQYTGVNVDSYQTEIVPDATISNHRDLLALLSTWSELA